MPCFKPIKDDLLRKTDQLIDNYQVTGPFLEIGCGDGTFTAGLARRGWSGVSLDLSSAAIVATSQRLSALNLATQITIARTNFFNFEPPGKFGLIMMYDVLEHVERDRDMLQRIRSMLTIGGHLLVSVPVKMKEWRWDDDQYGHIRRYEQDELDALLNDVGQGFEMLVRWDITFPVIWFMRRVYTGLLSPRASGETMSMELKTQRSAFSSSAGDGAFMRLVEALPFWSLAFWIQDRFRQKFYGCNTLILARAI